MFERFILSTGAALLLMAAPLGAVPRMVPNQPAQISGGPLHVACEPGDPVCQENSGPPQMQAPDQPKSHGLDQPKFHESDHSKLRASDQPKFRPRKNLPEAYEPGVEKKHSQKELWKRPPPDGKCSPEKEKCHPKKHRHRRFHDYPDYFDYYVYPPFDYHYLVSCSRARIVLQRNGFRSIRLIACGAKYHTFTARKGNGKFVVRVRARSGAIFILRRIS